MDAAAVSHQLVVRALLVHGATRRSKGLLEVILGPPYLIEWGGTGKKTPVDLTKMKIHKAAIQSLFEQQVNRLTENQL